MPSLLTETEVGYQPVGMRPLTCLEARFTTATAFSNPSVTYNVFSSGLRAAELGFEPLYLSSGLDSEIVRTTFSAAVSITEIVSLLPFTTYKVFWSLDRTVRFGWSPTRIEVKVPLAMSTAITWSSRWLVTNAIFAEPSRLETTATSYGNSPWATVPPGVKNLTSRMTERVAVSTTEMESFSKFAATSVFPSRLIASPATTAPPTIRDLPLNVTAWAAFVPLRMEPSYLGNGALGLEL